MDIDKIEKIKRQIDDLRDELRAKECHISGLLEENTLLRDRLDLFSKDLAVYEQDQIRKGKVTDVLVEYRKENEELKKKILYLNDDIKYWKELLQDEINFSSNEIKKQQKSNEEIKKLKKDFEKVNKFKYALLEDNSDKKRTIRRLKRLNTELQKEKVEQVSFTGMLDMQKKINKLKRKNKKAGKMIANQKQQIHEERKENLENSRIIRSIRDELFGPQVVVFTPTYGYKEEKKRIVEKIKDLKEKAYMNDATYRYMTDLETKNRELKIENMRLKEGKFPIR